MIDITINLIRRKFHAERPADMKNLTAAMIKGIREIRNALKKSKITVQSEYL
jgi:hypothetical protein